MDNEKMNGLSMDIELTEREKLRSLFPQCFTDGGLNIDKLLAGCGEFIDPDENDRERYEFRWKGKQWILVFTKTMQFSACLEGGTRKYYETLGGNFK